MRHECPFAWIDNLTTDFYRYKATSNDEVYIDLGSPTTVHAIIFKQGGNTLGLRIGHRRLPATFSV
jgi:hypothetical protein